MAGAGIIRAEFGQRKFEIAGRSRGAFNRGARVKGAAAMLKAALQGHIVDLHDSHGRGSETDRQHSTRCGALSVRNFEQAPIVWALLDISDTSHVPQSSRM